MFSSRRLQLLAFVAMILAIAAILPSGYYFRVAALIWMFGLAAIGLNLLMGVAGQVSLGHAGFIGVGAYSVALLPPHFGVPPLLAVLLGMLLSALVAWVVGFAVLRLKGHFLAIGTLGMGMLIALVIVTESRWTGGPDGMKVPALSVLGYPIISPLQWYWVSAAVLVAGAAIAVNIKGSATGRAMQALHTSEVAAAMSGIDTAKYKLHAFLIAAVYASATGSMIALMNRFITPDQASFLQSIELVMMVIVGGLGSVFGSIAGAAVIVVLPQALASFHEYEMLLLGLILMAITGFSREGLVPALAQLIARRTP